MKKILTLLVSCSAFLLSEANVITVSNNVNSPGQYTDLQTAINSAVSGDTIYVHGSPVSYGNVSVSKRLTFIGTGHNPNKAIPSVSEVGILQLDSVPGTSGASGTKIIGFKLTSVFGYTGSGGTKNVLINRNYIISTGSQVYITGSGWVIEHNIFGKSVNVNNNSNTFINNNIFTGSYSGVVYSDKSTVNIINNIFFGAIPSSPFSNIANANIANNIFSGASPKGPLVDNNIFSNNITYQTNYDTIPYGTNLGSGNFVAKNPDFVNVPVKAFNYSYNFSLALTSVGINAGTDGKDVGIYGGSSPFPGDLTGSPAIPQVKSLTVLNPVIPVGDSLKVVIKAKKQN